MVNSDYCGCNTEYATWQVMEEYMPRDVLTEYKRAFNQFDPDSIGVIRLEDVAQIIKQYGYEYSVRNISNILRRLTENGCCSPFNESFVDFSEFLAVMSTTAENCIPEDEMFRIFKRFDQDGDGFISKAELRCLFIKLGEEITENELKEMIEIADKDGDGMVSYNEFVKLVTNSWDEVENLEQSLAARTLNTSRCYCKKNITQFLGTDLPSRLKNCKTHNLKNEMVFFIRDTTRKLQKIANKRKSTSPFAGKKIKSEFASNSLASNSLITRFKNNQNYSLSQTDLRAIKGYRQKGKRFSTASIFGLKNAIKNKDWNSSI